LDFVVDVAAVLAAGAFASVPANAVNERGTDECPDTGIKPVEITVSVDAESIKARPNFMTCTQKQTRPWDNYIENGIAHAYKCQ
jgi:hypothetical protein